MVVVYALLGVLVSVFAYWALALEDITSVPWSQVLDWISRWNPLTVQSLIAVLGALALGSIPAGLISGVFLGHASGGRMFGFIVLLILAGGLALFAYLTYLAVAALSPRDSDG